METNGNGQSLPRVLLALYTKKVGGNKLALNGKHVKHGVIGWAEFEGVEGRKPLYFNEYLAEETPWLDRWMCLEDLRKTPKRVYVDEESRINHWLRRKVAAGLVVLVGYPKGGDKTESVGRRPNPKTAPHIGGGIYA